MKFERRMRPMLGTFVELGVGPGPMAGACMDAGFAAIALVHRLLSFQRDDSDLYRMNQSFGRRVNLHPLTVRVLRLARAFTLATRQRFNCTLGGALVRRGFLPNPGGMEFLEQGTADDIIIHDRTSVELRRPVYVTLDGFAKGFAVDLAVRQMRRFGAASGWVNAGGDMRVFGDAVLPLAVRAQDDGFRIIGLLRQHAAATSCATTESQRRFPACLVTTAGTLASEGTWTILARQAWRADALTKVAAQVPRADCAEVIRRLGGSLLTHQGSVS